MKTNKPELCRSQPCGCVICTCEHETQCQGCGGHHCGTHPVGQFSNPVYQQSTERKPPADGSLTPVPDELFAAEFNAWWEQHGQFCRAGGGDYERTFAFEAWRHLYPKLMKLQKVAAEQQPAPDVAGLEPFINKATGEKAMNKPKNRHRNLRSLMREGSADFDPVPARQPAPDVKALVEALELARIDLEEWLKSFPNASREPTGKIIERIDAALDAHRKQGGDQS